MSGQSNERDALSLNYDLPPRDVWLYDPLVKGRKKTPLDERGFVDVVSLIQIINESIDPSYQWEPGRNLHHLQWSNDRYPSLPEALVDPHRFRELRSNKVMLPAQYHRWLHFLTDIPKVPNNENMHEAIIAQEAVDALRNIVSFARQTAEDYGRNPDHQLQVYQQMLETSMDVFGQGVEAVNATPPEYRIVDLSQYRLETTDDVRRIARDIATMSMVTTPDVSRYMQLAEAA
jgi:hypothetical protein